MSNVLVRDLPDDVHAGLQRRAAAAGQSLQQYLTAELTRLATGVRAAGNKAGAPAAGGPFHPHITLARLRGPAEATRWVRILDSYQGPAWPARRITLIASHLGEGPRRRPRYEPVASFDLGEAATG